MELRDDSGSFTSQRSRLELDLPQARVSDGQRSAHRRYAPDPRARGDRVALASRRDRVLALAAHGLAMSGSLRALQQRWLEAVLDPDSKAPAALSRCTGGVYGVAAGFALYVNHMRATVLRALAACYPATQALLGKPAFRRAVAAYLRDSPPKAGSMGSYGEGFPDYAAAAGNVCRRSIVQAVARYEWLVDQLAGTVREQAWPLAEAAQLHSHAWPTLRLRLVCNARLVYSPVRVRAWIQQAFTNTPLPEGTDERLLLVAGESRVEVLELQEAEYAFVAAMAGQDFVDAATRAALASDPTFDLRALLERLFDARALAPPVLATPAH
jgi:hypothetical protein